MESPVVSVICICYNHAAYVTEAMNSVLRQTHPNVQLIVIDDASTDGSADVINRFVHDHPGIVFLPLHQNQGICRVFNHALAQAKGEFIIDLAADDVLLPSRITAGLKAFDSLAEDYGVNFADAELIDSSGNRVGYHSDRFPHSSVPQGNIYAKVIEHYFINSPTMMVRRQVLDKLGGYDESLAYEDFDFWIRSSRDWKYVYTPEALVQRRILKGSMSDTQYRKGSPQLISTYLVCEKIKALNRTLDEKRALRRRILYEMRRAFMLVELRLAMAYINLLLR